jgi:hypothetical protein
MKKLVFILFSVTLIYACSSDSSDPTPGGGGMSEENDECEGTSFTFANDVQAIINTNCALSGCHVAGNSQGLPDYTTYAGVFDKRGAISSRVGAKTMPPSNSGLTLTDAQIKTVVCWVKSGAPQ